MYQPSMLKDVQWIPLFKYSLKMSWPVIIESTVCIALHQSNLDFSYVWTAVVYEFTVPACGWSSREYLRVHAE